MLNALKTLWAEPAVDRPPPPAVADWILAGVVLSAALVEVVFRQDLVWRPVALVFGVALASAVAWRRARSLAVVGLGFGTFVVVDVATFLAGAEPFVLYAGSVVVVFAYALFRWGSGRDAATGMLIMAASVVASVTTNFTGAVDAVGGAVVLVAAAALGIAMRYRNVARVQLVEQAKLQEREQLARELHDTVAHHVSAIAIQAQAGLVLAQSGSLSGATGALATIEGEAATTLDEMRIMVSALRDRHAHVDAAPRRGIADIERLESLSSPPVRVVVDLTGKLDNLPVAVETALFRVAQESVTNALRHADQATYIGVKLGATATDVHLTITDNGSGAASSNPPGYGLVGMNERLTLLDGTFTAGPDPAGGWTVTVVLPRRGSAT